LLQVPTSGRLKRKLRSGFRAVPRQLQLGCRTKLELGESIVDTAVREVKEETGLDVEVTGLIGVYTNPSHVTAYTDGEVRQQFSLCFTTRLLGGDLLADSESTDIAWTASRDIPSLNMHPSMRLRIQHYLEHRDTPFLG
jgi:8-oxo-dGTP pyrophosphatase MutT (NUDIX family)